MDNVTQLSNEWNQSLDNLPDEVLRIIMQEITEISDFMNLENVSRKFRALAKEINWSTIGEIDIITDNNYSEKPGCESARVNGFQLKGQCRISPGIHFFWVRCKNLHTINLQLNGSCFEEMKTLSRCQAEYPRDIESFRVAFDESGNFATKFDHLGYMDFFVKNLVRELAELLERLNERSLREVHLRMGPVCGNYDKIMEEDSTIAEYDICTTLAKFSHLNYLHLVYFPVKYSRLAEVLSLNSGTLIEFSLTKCYCRAFTVFGMLITSETKFDALRKLTFNESVLRMAFCQNYNLWQLFPQV